MGARPRQRRMRQQAAAHRKVRTGLGAGATNQERHTMSNTPSDAEIESLWDCYVGEPTAKLPLTRGDKFAFACAVLAKWGTPQPVVREPLTDAQIAEMMRDTWGCASIAPRHALEFARAVERAHGITQKGGS